MNYLYVAIGSVVGALAMLNVVASVALALAAVFAGSYMARLALGRP